MTDLSRKEWAWLAAGIAIVGAGLYAVNTRIGGPNTGPSGRAPREEAIAPAVILGSSGSNMLGISNTGAMTYGSCLSHLFHPFSDFGHASPGSDYQHHVRVRYPTVPGSNISTLIHYGYSPMLMPSARDYDWFTNPPADIEFAGGS